MIKSCSINHSATALFIRPGSRIRRTLPGVVLMAYISLWDRDLRFEILEVAVELVSVELGQREGPEHWPDVRLDVDSVSLERRRGPVAFDVAGHPSVEDSPKVLDVVVFTRPPTTSAISSSSACRARRIPPLNPRETCLGFPVLGSLPTWARSSQARPRGRSRIVPLILASRFVGQK